MTGGAIHANIKILMKSYELSFATVNQNRFVVPLPYNNILQGFIYSLLRKNDENFSTKIHDNGDTTLDNRQFKSFCFSSLRGRKENIGFNLHFKGKFYFDIRTVSQEISDILDSAFSSKKVFTLNDQLVTLANVKESDEPITKGEMIVQMQSPLIVNLPDRTYGTKYLTPDEEGFSELIENNFKKKWQAYYGQEPEEGIKLQCLEYRKNGKPIFFGRNRDVNLKNKDGTTKKYRGDPMPNVRGKFLLTGKPEYLTFLYYAGLGMKNSGGFGLFNEA
jgi:CRISPR-associated endoribonuclease Cas6